MDRRTGLACVFLAVAANAHAIGHPVRARKSMVVSQQAIASRVGSEVLEAGGNAIDAAVATAFALAVVYPAAGNIGGGGYLVYRPASGAPVAYDFRETAPAGARPGMFLRGGAYDAALHHDSSLAVGVPGTVAGLHAAWKDHGHLPWARLVAPAIALARDGFVLSDNLARLLGEVLPALRISPAAVAQFSHEGRPYAGGETLVQADLARTLERIAHDPADFYTGETARLIANEMKARGGLVTMADLAAYVPARRAPLTGTYRGYDVVTMPPSSGGGVTLLESLNVLEGYDLGARGYGSADAIHVMVEAMRRAFADRARFLGDPDQSPDMPVARLISKDYAAALRRTIREDAATPSSPERFEWPEGADTTHLSVVDEPRDAVALTFTLEDAFGVKIVVPGAGFLLNNEMGDFNAAPGLTTAEGLVGTPPNLAAPGRRMLSSMTPTILSLKGVPFLVLGSPGGRKIANAVLEAIVNVVDFGMNVKDAVDAPRFHHQWLPDQILHEPSAFSPDTLAILARRGHRLDDRWPAASPTSVHAIRIAADGTLEGAADRRAPDGAAIGR